MCFAVDMTMLASMEPRSLDSPSDETARQNEPENDEEQALRSNTSTPFTLRGNGHRATASDETELQTRSSTAIGTSTNFIKRKTSQLLEAIAPGSQSRDDAPLPPKLAALVEAFKNSDVAAELKTEITEVEAESRQQQQLPDVALENSLTRGRQHASWGTQFTILSGRAFKNLYRNPALLAAHYISAITVACELYLDGHSDVANINLCSDLWSALLPLWLRYSGYAEPTGYVCSFIEAVMGY
jgi:hypothetical protein